MQLARNTIGWLLRWRHPLWWLPDIPSEQDEAYRRIWQHLRQVSSVVDGRHDTAGWRSRNGDFVLCCVRIPAGELHPSLDEAREALSQFPFVRLHPDHFLHIPVQELGFLTTNPGRRDEFGQEWLDEFVVQAENPISEFGQFDVTLGGLNSFVDALFLDVHDNGWLHRIQARLIDFVAIPPNTQYSYLPEATIAHYTESAPMENLVATLTPWRDQMFGTFHVESIDVVKLQTGEPYPELELVHRFELGQQHSLLTTVQPS